MWTAVRRKNKPLRRFSSRLSSSTTGSEWPWPWNISLPWSTSPKLPISFFPHSANKERLATICYSASSFCCSHLMIGGRAAAHRNELAWLGLYGTAGFFRSTPLSPLSLRGEIDLWSGGRMSAVEEKAWRPGHSDKWSRVPKSPVYSTELAWEWRQLWCDLFLEPNYTAKQTFDPSKHNQQMMSCWDETFLNDGLTYDVYQFKYSAFHIFNIHFILLLEFTRERVRQ